MNQIKNIRNTLMITICYLTALLFIYAATSKGLDYENFSIQLGQSPLLSAFANWVSVTVPFAEIALALGLFIPRLRFVSLLGSFTLMVMFTAYIYIILNYSVFVPCSCGGVLEKLTWNQHFIFNLIFVVLIGIAIIFIPIQNTKIITNKKQS